MAKQVIIRMIKDMAHVKCNGVEIRATYQHATLSGPAQTVTVKPYSVISFRGVATSYQVRKIHPTGLSLIDSDSSLVDYFTWDRLTRGSFILADCLQRTGWASVR